MSLKIIWDDKVRKDNKKLDYDISERIVKKMKNIRLNPERYMFTLINKSNLKIRVGDYRLFVDYYEKDNKLIIRSIRHRKNAYKK
jgi:mRNA interferase RelE/StbE